MTTIVIPREHDGYAYSFRADGWFNMTKAAKHYGKDLSNFLRLPSTLEYLEALSVIYPGIELYAVKRGNGNLPSVGTWAHPKLAGFYARWLDVRFAVWCDSVIEDILKGVAQVTITKPEASAVVALPQDYEGALEALLLSVRDAKSLALPTSFAQALRLAAEQADVIEAQAVTSPTLRTAE